MKADECAALQDRVAGLRKVALKSSVIAVRLCYERREFLDGLVPDFERFKPIADILHVISAQAAGTGRGGGKLGPFFNRLLPQVGGPGAVVDSDKGPDGRAGSELTGVHLS